MKLYVIVNAFARANARANARAKTFTKALIALMLVGGLAACASKTPATRYYLLSNPDQVASGPSLDEGSCQVQLGRATVAPYLQRTHIMLQTGQNELVPAMQHRWSEPLEAGVSRLLAQCLGGGDQASHKARVQIDHLHGNTAGKVVLQARWSLTGSRQTAQKAGLSATLERQFSGSAPQPAAGYDALVSTQRELVLRLCADIKSAAAEC